ncbi:glycosyltransferase family 4 protein [Alteromonas sp. H39]|uniref:glycosyltransferase family 4 protein n=1 Tax=Alteromonas sp. H39 TaxID=3389876 RepID=UPI0039E0435E
MNVLYVANSGEIGGGNRSLELLMTGIRDKGITPVVIVPEEGEAADLFRRQGIKVFVLHITPPNMANALRYVSFLVKLSRIVKAEKIKLVHTNGTLAARSVSTICHWMTLPLITHVRFDLGPDYYRWAFKKLHPPQHFIFVSHYMKSSIAKYLSCGKSSAFSVIHNAVMDKQVPPSPPTHEIKNIGIIANLQKVKGHEDFLEMAKRLLQKMPQLQFHIIGGDNLKQNRDKELESYASTLGIQSNVTFHGFVLDVDEKIKQLDLVICPSHEEPFGRCAIEAMQYGKPVIITRVGGLPEIVSEPENGFIVPPHRPDLLAEAVEKVVEADYEKFYTANTTKIKKQFSKERHINEVFEIYRQYL